MPFPHIEVWPARELVLRPWSLSGDWILLLGVYFTNSENGSLHAAPNSFFSSSVSR